MQSGLSFGGKGKMADSLNLQGRKFVVRSFMVPLFHRAGRTSLTLIKKKVLMKSGCAAERKSSMQVASAALRH